MVIQIELCLVDSRCSNNKGVKDGKNFIDVRVVQTLLSLKKIILVTTKICIYQCVKVICSESKVRINIYESENKFVYQCNYGQFKRQN